MLLTKFGKHPIKHVEEEAIIVRKKERKKELETAPFAKGTGKVRRMEEVTAFLVKKTFWPLWSQIEIWANKFWRGVNLMHMHELHW